MTVIKLPPYSPDLNAYAERWVQSVKEECFDHFIVFGDEHMRYQSDEYVKFNNTYRPHQGIGNVPISADGTSPPGDPPAFKDV